MTLWRSSGASTSVPDYPRVQMQQKLTLGSKNNITPTSELALKSDYHLFKRGVRPEWEVRCLLAFMKIQAAVAEPALSVGSAK